MRKNSTAKPSAVPCKRDPDMALNDHQQHQLDTLLSQTASLAESLTGQPEELLDLLRQIDGREVQVNNEPFVIDAADLVVEQLEPNWRQKILTTIASPEIAILLLMIGLYGLLFEGYNPGAILPGVAGVALSQLTNVGPNMGQAYIIDSFMVVVFGGVGNLWGTLVAGMTLGVANKIMEPWAGAVLAKILVLVFIILFIQKRPRGMFALKGRAVEA